LKQIPAIIPARRGSVGIPLKNIAMVGSHPLIAYSIIACKLSKKINRVIVSTDDREIARISKSYGAEVPFIRPSKYARNNSRDVEFLKHFFDNINVDDAALIRPTTPLRDPSIMDAAIDIYYEMRGQISSLRSLNKINQSPYKMFAIKNNMCTGLFENFRGMKDYSNLPRQEFPPCYEGNGHIDIVNRTTVERGTAFGTKIYAFIVDKIIDIDVPFDLEILRLQIKTEKDLLTKHLEKR
jgi:CMP-N-acetylneuraminic acid synthetase